MSYICPLKSCKEGGEEVKEGSKGIEKIGACIHEKLLLGLAVIVVVIVAVVKILIK